MYHYSCLIGVPLFIETLCSRLEANFEKQTGGKELSTRREGGAAVADRGEGGVHHVQPMMIGHLLCCLLVHLTC